MGGASLVAQHQERGNIPKENKGSLFSDVCPRGGKEMNRVLVACGLIASVLIGAVLVFVIEAALAMRMRRTKAAHKPEQQLGDG